MQQDPNLNPEDVSAIRVVGRVAAPLREQTLEVLRDAILDFRLKPGQRLIERELVEQTRVSRTTIREVLRELAAEGLVTTIPQKGAVVVSTTAKEAEDLYEVRAALERLATRLFVERAGAEQMAALGEAVDKFAAVAAGDDIRDMLRAKDEFYAVLLAGAGNKAINEMLSSIQARVRVMRAASLSQPGRPAVALKELQQLFEAIRRRDLDAAARCAETHIAHASATGLAVLGESDLTFRNEGRAPKGGTGS
jgi:DNA-binding GntR family transcriptional regulator